MPPHAFVELHIEQGPVLEAEGVTIGAVTGVQGISWHELTITGQSNHAGTTPMDHAPRRRATSPAAIAVCVRELADASSGRRQVGTVGRIELHPNLVNVVAGRATLTVDLRNTDDDRARRGRGGALARSATSCAADEGVQHRRPRRWPASSR